MKPSCFLLVVLVSASLCGCVTIEVITPERLSGQQFAADSVPVAHIRADNWGWYLFNFVPLIAGNSADPGVPSFFSHTVRLGPLVEVVMRRSQELGATVTDLQSTNKSGWKPYTLILWIREVEITANASRPPH